MEHPILPLPSQECMGRPPVAYRKPTLLTTYSHRPDRSLAHDDSAVAIYKGAPLGSDLYYGFEDRIERDEQVEEHLDGLCEALQRQAETGRRWKSGGVVTWRGMATRLMAAPFEENEGWEMTAVALNGTVYVEYYEPLEAKRAKLQEQKSYAKQSYVGYSFESYSTQSPNGVPEPTGPPGWSGTVNTNVQWCCVVESAIDGLPLTLGGEVDCVTECPPSLEKTVELKTNMVIQNPRHDATFHKKLLKHWAQSYLLGVPTIEVGFRDSDGILRGLKRFETIRIPRLVTSAPSAPWHPNPSLAYLRDVVGFLTTHVLPSDPHPPSSAPLALEEPLPEAVVWRLKFTPSQGCELRHVEPETSRWGDILKEDFVRWIVGQ